MSGPRFGVFTIFRVTIVLMTAQIVYSYAVILSPNQTSRQLPQDHSLSLLPL